MIESNIFFEKSEDIQQVSLTKIVEGDVIENIINSSVFNKRNCK